MRLGEVADNFFANILEDKFEVNCVDYINKGIMLTCNEQQDAFIKLINFLNNFPIDNNICMNVPKWDEQRGVGGFPNHLSVCFEYQDIQNSKMNVQFNLDCNNANWNKIEIVTLDICASYWGKGRGKKFVQLVLDIAKGIGAKTVYGTCLEMENGYSSTGFYKKLGFEITEQINSPATFRKKL